MNILPETPPGATLGVSAGTPALKHRESKLQRAARELDEAEVALLAAIQHAADAEVALEKARDELHLARKRADRARGSLKWIRDSGVSR